MQPQRKITVLVPRELLAKAQRVTRAGVSETVRKGLELLAASEAFDRLLEKRGKLRVSTDLNELRRDRR